MTFGDVRDMVMTMFLIMYAIFRSLFVAAGYVFVLALIGIIPLCIFFFALHVWSASMNILDSVVNFFR